MEANKKVMVSKEMILLMEQIQLLTWDANSLGMYKTW